MANLWRILADCSEKPGAIKADAFLLGALSKLRRVVRGEAAMRTEAAALHRGDTFDAIPPDVLRAVFGD